MILSTNDILNIIKENPGKNVVGLAQKMRKNLFVHIYGVGMDEYIQKINSFENNDQYIARKKYARSNKDIMERVSRPIDKIFSATGGSTFYDLPDRQNQIFRDKLRNTENGLTLRKWVEQYWKPAYLADPMGLVFMEVDGNGDAYPTYKGSNEVFSYKLNGRNLDYVIFNVGKEQVPCDSQPKLPKSVSSGKKRYRVVDDLNDLIVEYENEHIKIIKEESYPNYFGIVPAIINSDLPILGTDYFCSPFEKVVELADEYLRECSVKSVYKLLHGFPKYWEYQSQCPKCLGTGYVEGSECSTCKGTGYKLKWDVSDVKHLPVPESGDTKIAPDVAGYVAPDIDAWDKMSEELKDLETLMFKTIWGTKELEDTENETATGKFIDTQPINDRLTKFSEAAETIEKFITDQMGAFYFGNSYKGSSVNYGRRFQIETPDAIWNKYESARKSGAPDTMLDDLLMEYIQSKYENNSIELQKQIKSLELEPFPHITASQVKALNVSGMDYTKKVYFTEFVKTLSDNEIIFTQTKVLQQKFDEYVKDKLIVNQNEETGSIRPNQE
ncbi:hypothetical protein M2459_001355 [Parabacteroides sp. PF5-5]|uniref:hypothetical protein n=1 Tax=unclassified Parabacteroides TaxID=2649774 RepID=UPI00247433BA|nr:MULTISPECIES: hypothetical protein [unclassified Parabacteroides]MDH6304620.1 hypothetical protein [Parabacteroides sp. PH5-39]MDH6315767.1 hypothetical protein [Parabacteroides sp. PF5-13]MDH6319426.1 hypothetical protein [Parabacteroides sp. PH5-13]MDH6323157.1 hypothetical protein [Parabacteroides sp. PH5-8]MDH6326959.1 hypothetical protein [Parabacteroides sp. PH5-41]